MRQLTIIGLNMALVFAAIWAVSRDYCLIGNAPFAIPIDASALTLGLSGQLVALVLFWALTNRSGRSPGFLREYFRNKILRALGLVIPFLFLFLSHDLIASALYSAGANNKMETARHVEDALAACRAPLGL